MSYGHPTSRRHPRTLADAFPCERANAIERPASRNKWADRAMAAAIGVTLAVVCWFGF